MRRYLNWRTAALLMLTGLVACGPRPSEEEARMKQGLEALHMHHDPYAAAAQFRIVVERNPAHYAANHELALALDAAGEEEQAQWAWEKVLVLADSVGDKQTADAAHVRLGLRRAGRQEKGQEDLMRAGLDALYATREPKTAIAKFNELLAVNPTHYGATYQLAKALDAAGIPSEARAQWEKVLRMAEQAKDEQTIDAARVRLAKPDVVSADTLMSAGLYRLHTLRDPAAAVIDFREVLELVPQHYGATYQLAAALDAAGKRDEAGPLWEKVLHLAEAVNDKAAADTARARLGQEP